MRIRSIAQALAAVGLTALTLTAPVKAADKAPQDIIRANCLTCHTEKDGHFSRISDQRKTPEGWLMTLARMQIMHGVKVEAEDRRALVKHLADTQGLAPSETEGVRYALERRLNTIESFESDQFTQMCARCHSGARVMLQRRPASEWEHLVHFHLGQWPTTEYQALARDRDWFELALGEMVPALAKELPLESDAWTKWQAAPAAKVAGGWTLSGNLPGKGGFSASMQLTAGAAKDQYKLTLEGAYDDGTPLRGEGEVLIYTGYEWRGSLTVDGIAMRQVFALAGETLAGRMFQSENDEIGADVVAARQDSATSHVLGVHPAFIKAGSEADLTIVGTGLKGKPVLPKGVSLVKVVSASPDRMVLRVRADASARGVHPVKVGTAAGGALALYDKVAAVKVVPDYNIARVGGNGGSTPPVQGRFEAEAWAAGPDGVAGTDDDFRIGIMPAAWSVEPFNEVAAEDGDVKFSGVMDARSGIFSPAGAGPNPERRMTTNNAGNLTVIAEVADGEAKVQGKGQMIVTIQRWNNPPIP